MNNNDIIINLSNLSLMDIDIILGGLGEIAAKQSFDVITKIKAQVERQLAEIEKSTQEAEKEQSAQEAE